MLCIERADRKLNIETGFLRDLQDEAFVDVPCKAGFSGFDTVTARRQIHGRISARGVSDNSGGSIGSFVRDFDLNSRKNSAAIVCDCTE